jgi:hypothetical protein
MSAIAPARSRLSPLAALRWTVRIAAIVWGAFWAWFAAAVSIGDAIHGQPIGLVYAAALIGILAATVTALWRWPRVGGVVLVALGILSALFLQNEYAILILAAPALLLGTTAWLTVEPRNTGTRAGERAG